MSNNIISLSPSARKILYPRHRVFKPSTAKRTLATVAVMAACAEYLDTLNESVAAHCLHTKSMQLLERQPHLSV